MSAQGKGRKSMYTDEMVDYIIKLRDNGNTYREISTIFNKTYNILRHETTIKRICHNPEIYKRGRRIVPIDKEDRKTRPKILNIYDSIEILSNINDVGSISKNKILSRMMDYLEDPRAEEIILKHGEGGMKLGKFLPIHTNKYHEALKDYPNYTLSMCCTDYLANQHTNNDTFSLNYFL